MSLIKRTAIVFFFFQLTLIVSASAQSSTPPVHNAAQGVIRNNSSVLPPCHTVSPGTQCTAGYGLDGAPTNLPSQNAAALGGQGSNSAAGQIAQQIGNALIAKGTAMMASCCPTGSGCCGTGAMLVGMGMAGLAQSAANKSTASNHAVNASMNTATDTTYNTRSPDISKLAGFDEALGALNQHGYTYDAAKNKFTTPDGKSYSMEDLSNAAAMGAAGVSEGEFKKAMAAAKAADKEASQSIAAMPVDGFASGGGGAYSPPPAPTETVSYGGPRVREPTSVAGMVRKYNGESIGVAGDSIFAMMARRYREKNSKDNFLPPESAPQ